MTYDYSLERSRSAQAAVREAFRWFAVEAEQELVRGELDAEAEATLELVAITRTLKARGANPKTWHGRAS